jgi:hypothetical protein
MPAAPPTNEPTPPLGSWSRIYALVCVLAVAMMLLLWWFTSHYNVRPGPP